MARGAWPDPRHGKHFPTPEKIFSETFLIGWIPYIARGTILEKFFWRASGTGPVEPQGHDLCLWHVCTLYITTHMSTCTVGTCQFCPAMSEGESKHSDFSKKRVQYCKNTLLRLQRSKNEISKHDFRFQTAKFNFQVPLKSRVRSPAYNNMTKP